MLGAENQKLQGGSESVSRIFARRGDSSEKLLELLRRRAAKEDLPEPVSVSDAGQHRADDVVRDLESIVEDVGGHPEFRRREGAEPHGVADPDERLGPNPAVSKHPGEVALYEFPVFHEDRIFLDQLRPIFAERLDRLIHYLSVLGLKTDPEFLDQPLELARVRAAEEERLGLLRVLRDQFFDVPRLNLREFPVLDERLFKALAERGHPENPLPERPALRLLRQLGLRLVLRRLWLGLRLLIGGLFLSRKIL